MLARQLNCSPDSRIACQTAGLLVALGPHHMTFPPPPARRFHSRNPENPPGSLTRGCLVQNVSEALTRGCYAKSSRSLHSRPPEFPQEASLGAKRWKSFWRPHSREFWKSLRRSHSRKSWKSCGKPHSRESQKSSRRPHSRIACQTAGLLARQPDCLPDSLIACQTTELLTRQPDCLPNSRIAC